MIEQSNLLPYVPEKNLNKEGLRKVGVGLFIVDIDSSKIWVVQEKKGKNGHHGTGREIGDFTIPLETRKYGEKIIDNVLGGLAEFRQLCDKEEMIWIDGFSYVGRYPLVDGVVADLIIIGLRNRCTDEVSSVNSEEVDPIGWMALNELRNQPQLRKGVSSFIDLAVAHHWIEDFVYTVNQGKHRERIVDSSLDLNSIYQERELLSDIG